MNETTTQTTRRHFTDKPINYHLAVEEDFDDWADACGLDPQSLRQAGEEAIRSRHHEASPHEAYRACGNQPSVFVLSFGAVEVFYTVEPLEVVIRGYGWEIEGEPVDDRDGGFFYVDASWNPELLASIRKTQIQAKTLPVPQEFVGAVREVLDYLWDEERRQYGECTKGSQAGHVFESLRRIKQWLDEHFPTRDSAKKEDT
jgi:hypothetical protein